MFQLGNRSRKGGLGGAKAFGRLAHAAGLNHGHEDAHIVQFQAALDAIDLVHGAASYNKLDIPSSNNSIITFRIRALFLNDCGY
jgi:hypothetical protein